MAKSTHDFYFQVKFNSMLVVKQQFYSYLYLEFIADIGGCVGIFLGYSLYDIAHLVVFVMTSIKKFGEISTYLKMN